MGRLTRMMEMGKRLSISICALNEPTKRALAERALCNQEFTAVLNRIYPIVCERQNNLLLATLNLELMMVLMLRAGGARTAQEIAELLEARKSRDIVMESLDAMLSGERMARGEVYLQISNKIFYDKKYHIDALFKSLAQGAFFTEMEAVEFNSQAANSLREINLWMDRTNGGKFKYFTPLEITPDSELVIVNLLYFTAKWKYPFYSQRKIKLPFFTMPNAPKIVEMLNNTQYYGYRRLRNINARMLVIPYIGDAIVFVIILPDEKDGLTDVESNLPTINIMKTIMTVRHPEVELWLPQFRFECTLDLTEDLKAAGVCTLFDRYHAHLWQMTKMKGDGLFVSRVLQKTIIDVNDENSKIHENIFMMPSAVSPSKKRQFKVDRPFIFCVVNTDVQTMLLIGRVKTVI